MLAYTYLGYDGGPQGWYREVLRQPSADACYEWGVWLGSRYQAKANLVWFALGDYTPPPGSEGARRVRRIIDGIKAAGATQLFMAEMSPPDTLPSDVPGFDVVIDQNSFYGYGPRSNGLVYETADRAWSVTPPRPAWQQEGIYELDPNVKAFTGAPWETRRARFWSVLAAARPETASARATRTSGCASRPNLFSPGRAYSAAAFRLFASLPWWKLRPSGTGPGYAGRDLVLAGGGCGARRITSPPPSPQRHPPARLRAADRSGAPDDHRRSGRAQWSTPRSVVQTPPPAPGPKSR
jgi:hypothetical protein